MSSSNKQYTPTMNARPTWREREAMKARQQREAAAQAAEDARRKQIANTEENFPTTLKQAKKKTVQVSSKFAELASKWQTEEEMERQLNEYRKANTERERAMIRNTVVFLRNRRMNYDDEEEDYEYEDITVVSEAEDEKFPPHGKRGTYTEPDEEGWRLVVKRQRKKVRELTEAELAQKYRDTFFGEGEEEDADMNGDLTDRNQRRDFY